MFSLSYFSTFTLFQVMKMCFYGFTDNNPAVNTWFSIMSHTLWLHSWRNAYFHSFQSPLDHEIILKETALNIPKTGGHSYLLRPWCWAFDGGPFDGATGFPADPLHVSGSRCTSKTHDCVGPSKTLFCSVSKAVPALASVKAHLLMFTLWVLPPLTDKTERCRWG